MTRNLNLELRLGAQVVANFVAKIGGFAYSLFLLPQIYSSTSQETTVQIYSFVAILMWCSADLGLTEALKNKLIKEGTGRNLDHSYLTSVFSNFILSSLLYISCVGAFFFLASDNYDLEKILFVIFLALMTIPQKYFREYLTAENALDKFFYIRFFSMIICAVPSIYFCKFYMLNFYSALILLNSFNILSTLLIIGYCRKILTWNIKNIRDLKLIFQDPDAIKVTIYLFFYGIFTVGLQDSAILYLEIIFPPSLVANINIILRSCQYVIVLNSLLILPLWPYIRRKSENIHPSLIIRKIFLLTIVLNLILFLGLYVGRGPIFSYLSANENVPMPLLEFVIFAYCFTRSLALVCSMFLKVMGLFRCLVFLSGSEFILMLFSIMVCYIFQLKAEVLFIYWTLTAVLTRILAPIVFIRKEKYK